MDPLLQYARAGDGVQIAYTALGSGPPLMITGAAAFGNVLGEWEIPSYRRFMETLAQRYRVIIYDTREAGSSEHGVADLSLEGFARDIAAVADKLSLEQFNLFGFYHTSLAAVVYAAANPERVRKLILWHGYARTKDHRTQPQVAAVRALKDASWEVYTETLARTTWGWENGVEASMWARMIRNSATAPGISRVIAAYDDADITDYLARVKCPTLLLYRKDARRYSADLGIGLASQIPGAELQLLPGDQMLYCSGDQERAIAAIEDFIDAGEQGRVARPQTTAGSIVTILFTDIENHTALMHRLGDERGREVLREHEAIVRDALRRHGGTEVKTLGDGFKASFSSVFRALECAIELQRTFDRRNQTAQEPVRVRIGLNAGEPIAEEADLFGSAVILAARTAAKAKGGEVVVTDVVRQLAAGKGFLFSQMGDTEMRGFEDPVRLFQLSWA